MESLDLLNLRAGECSLLELALADARRYAAGTFASDDKRQVVLVYPPLSARNRFLIHTLVQNHFSEFNTISIGNSYGRRTVVYHSSLKPMFRETKLEDSNETPDENDMEKNRPWRTPHERKAQEKLMQSLMPKKKLDENPRLTQRKQCKRPDIPIYIPKALRGLASTTTNNNSNSSNNNSNSSNNNSNSSNNNSNLNLSEKFEANSGIQHGSNETSCSKKIKSSTPQLNHNNHSVFKSINSFKYVDLSNDMVFDNVSTEHLFDDVSYQISEPLSSSNLPDFLNKNDCNSNSSEVNRIIENKIPTLKNDEPQLNNVETTYDCCNNTSMTSDLPQNVSNIVGSTCTQDVAVVNISDFPISDITCQTALNGIIESDKNSITMDSKVDKVNVNHEIEIAVDNSNQCISSLETEYSSNCVNLCLDNSFSSGILTDSEEKSSTNTVGKLIDQPSPEVAKKSLEIVENNEQVSAKEKKMKKKKILNVDECSWEDLYDKEDDYIHPLLMKELVSTMGKVQVQCAKEDYSSHQTMEERSGNGECVIEVYGFSSDLKTIDLMNQFAEFRKKHFEIIWVDDTHALAVFESPYLADQALNTPFALVKTRPLKNAIKDSKLKAETVAPLPATRPKTCSALARRLVSSALGLKVNVSPDLLSAERSMLANAKEKKIRDAQLKLDIWNNEP